MLLFYSLGLMAITILIAKLTRLQSSAGLIGFCYIMPSSWRGWRQP